MRIFNRLIVVLALVGLFLLGFFAVIYGLGVLGYQMSGLQSKLNLNGIYSGLQSFVSGVEQGNLTPAGIAILVAVAVVGLILLILELKPRTPRRVRMQKGTYITRSAVSSEVDSATTNTPNVLKTTSKVKAKRGSGANVNLRADTKRGEDQKSIKRNLQSSVEGRLSQVGIPLSKVSTKLSESDPRQTGTRVR